ncbi:hypothetical protein [Ensifer sp. YR511]|uniref:hypothetical protein n=1 Tax=Ensifer sp. YR511 TaxID=1855294 RepID=UPI00088C0FB3|nr:hypothetical protein [Ensifer sp. YR511]SDN34858.1 hypothetical protein SAMN05216328_12414 [Ensifer sp. YR511]
MKSPWKYLVQLTSLGRTVKEPEGPREIKTEKSEGVVANRIVEVPDGVVGDRGAATTDTTVVAVDRNEGAPITTLDRASANEHAGPPPTKRRRRRRKASASDVAVANVVEYGDGESGAPHPPITFIDEMTILDEDIRQLRRRLSEKLRLQNTQLKKMLARFHTLS